MTVPPFPDPHDAEPGAPTARAERRVRLALRPAPGGAVRAGLRCGLFAAAATAGAMAGFARGDAGGMLAPFFTTGRMLLGVTAAEGGGAQLVAFLSGAALHVALVVAWAVLFARVAGGLRGARLWIAAALFSAGVYWVSDLLLPSLLQLGHGTRAFPSQVVLLHAVFALALVLGMRLAFSPGVREAQATTTLRV